MIGIGTPMSHNKIGITASFVPSQLFLNNLRPF
jgi:hypothetical protein